MKLSTNFKLNEFTYSKTADEYNVSNAPTKTAVINLKLLCNNILQPLRNYLNKPIFISSGFRSEEVNALVGGTINSQHLRGQACDFYVKNLTPFDIAKAVMDLNLDFDQMILYPDFVHISYTNIKTRENRRQLLYNQSYNGAKFN